MTERRIKVVIVDDSLLVRQMIADTLTTAAGCEVTAALADPALALERMRRDWPDVLIVDVDSPRVNGFAFMRQVRAERAIPILACSTLAVASANISLQALSAGATRVVRRPHLQNGSRPFSGDSCRELVSAVRAAVQRGRTVLPTKPPPLDLLRPKNSADVMLAPAPSTSVMGTSEAIIAIGTSTGGTQALEAVLTRLATSCRGIVIVQHMPERFTAMLAQRLNDLCQIEIREAVNGDRVFPGRALIAPGGKHMMVKRLGAQYQVEVAAGPLVNRHRPSVDVLFRSVAHIAGANALGILMTGMGDDGARGLKEMRDAGAKTIAQDEASCVVFGMPREAIKLGAAAQTLALDKIAQAMMAFSRTGNPFC